MEEWKNTKCGNCVIQRQKPICNSCIGYRYYKPMTNAQKIRSMTDEELADFIDYNGVDCARFCPDYKAGCSWTCKHNQGKDFLLKWLQSEAE